MIPYWSFSIRAHILAETMVGIAQGIRMAGTHVEAAALELGIGPARPSGRRNLEDDRNGEADRVPDRVPPGRIGQRALVVDRAVRGEGLQLLR